MQPNKAIVGDNAFAHEAGIHQDGVLKAAITYEIMTPQSIGRPSNELVLGKHSGRHAFRDRLQELGFALADAEFEDAFTALQGPRRQEEDRLQRGHPRARRAVRRGGGRAVRAREPRRAVGHVRGADGDRRDDGRRRSRRRRPGSGDGPVDAVFKAIVELTETKSELLQYQVKAITGGMDAQGEVTVTVTDDGRRVIGHGAHTDIIVASARAYVHALNKLEWHKRQRGADEPKGI